MIHRDVAGHDMNYDEYKKLCGKAWEGDYYCLCIDKSKKRDRGRNCICNESKNLYTEYTLETKHF